MVAEGRQGNANLALHWKLTASLSAGWGEYTPNGWEAEGGRHLSQNWHDFRSHPPTWEQRGIVNPTSKRVLHNNASLRFLSSTAYSRASSFHSWRKMVAEGRQGNANLALHWKLTASLSLLTMALPFPLALRAMTTMK